MCELCDHGKDFCGATGGTEAYGCTREKGHSGDHAACGSRESSHPIFRWPNPSVSHDSNGTTIYDISGHNRLVIAVAINEDEARKIVMSNSTITEQYERIIELEAALVSQRRTLGGEHDNTLEKLKTVQESASWELNDYAETVMRLNGEVRELTRSLQQISAYGDGRDGICPYGCDTPGIAQKTLSDMKARKIVAALNGGMKDA